MWETIAAQGVGACIMEWNDEWWKSNVPGEHKIAIV